jgi:hypothetical protein
MSGPRLRVNGGPSGSAIHNGEFGGKQVQQLIRNDREPAKEPGQLGDQHSRCDASGEDARSARARSLKAMPIFKQGLLIGRGVTVGILGQNSYDLAAHPGIDNEPHSATATLPK